MSLKRASDKTICRSIHSSGGFTLIELMVVVAIVGLLASVAVVRVERSIMLAKVAVTVEEIKGMAALVTQYTTDTGRLPPDCSSDCNASNDPYLNSLGVAGWSGPYMSLWDKAHPWGGHLTIWTSGDVDGDGQPDCIIEIDDDRPTMGGTDNSGRVPTEALLLIDKTFDDGDLGTGNARGDGLGFSTPQGEIDILCSAVGVSS